MKRLGIYTHFSFRSNSIKEKDRYEYWAAGGKKRRSRPSDHFIHVTCILRLVLVQLISVVSVLFERYTYFYNFWLARSSPGIFAFNLLKITLRILQTAYRLGI